MFVEKLNEWIYIQLPHSHTCWKSQAPRKKRESPEGNGTPLQYSCLENPMDGGAWKAAVHGVTEGRTRLSDFPFTFHLHALEKEMATHSSVLAWRIPGTGKPGGLPSMGSHRVGHDWSDLAAAAVAAAQSRCLWAFPSNNCFSLGLSWIASKSQALRPELILPAKSRVNTHKTELVLRGQLGYIFIERISWIKNTRCWRLWATFILATYPYMGANHVPGIILGSLQIPPFLILAMTSLDGYYIYPHFIFIVFLAFKSPILKWRKIKLFNHWIEEN